MKKTRRIASLLLAVVMMVAMAVTSWGATITIENGAAGSEYAAYQLLNATNAGELYAYTLNDKYTSILQTVTEKTEQADIVAYIAGLDGESTRDFADAVYQMLVANGTTADYTTSTNIFENVDQGYYLLAETKVGDATDTISLVMLDTAGDEAIKVSTKEDKPTVDKQVEEKNDSTGVSGVWGESADYDIGDTINYKITGTVSSKYDDYISYYYSFSDIMDAGLSLNKESIKVTIAGVEVTEQFDIVADTKDGKDYFTATANLKELTGVTITGDTEIVVTYTATLNENAISGEAGNKNTVVLEYENNPYHEGDGDPETPDKPEEPGKTPEDTNIVFTYDAVVNKTDKDGNALAGAGFTLYKWSAEAEGWVAVGNEITGETTFIFIGLDAGKYKLEETTVPDGYNKAADIIFEVVATYNTEKDPVELTGLKVQNEEGEVISGENLTFTADKVKGEVTTNVINNAGTELPETGGIGTTIFYVIGGILVLVAGVLLVTKRRMRAE